MPGIVEIETYGGGTGVANNTTALNSAATALGALGGGTIQFGPGTYNFTTFPNVLPAGVRLRGVGPSTRVKLTTATSGSFLRWLGSAVNALSLSANVAKDARAITVASTAGIAAGDLVYIERGRPITGGSLYYAVALRVRSVVGTTITFDGRIPFDILTTDTKSIYEIVPAVGGGVEDLVLDGWTATGTTVRAIDAQITTQQYFDGVRFEGWKGSASTGCGLFLYVGYENEIGNLSFYNSGSANESDLMAWRQTALRVGELRSELAPFGPQLPLCAYCTVDSVISTGSLQRGVKLNGSVRCLINSAIVDNAGSTGFVISIGSMDNVIGQLHLDRNEDVAGNSVGLWFSDQYNTNNLVGQIRMENSATYAITVFPTDTGNIIGEVLGAGLTIYNPGNAYFGGINGAVYRPVQGNQFGSASGSYLAPTPSNTNLVLYRVSASNWAGIGATPGGEIYFAAGAAGATTKALISSQSLAAGQTGLFLEFNTGAGLTFRQVEVGAPDSAGTGYRALRILNA